MLCGRRSRRLVLLVFFLAGRSYPFPRRLTRISINGRSSCESDRRRRYRDGSAAERLRLRLSYRLDTLVARNPRPPWILGSSRFPLRVTRNWQGCAVIRVVSSFSGRCGCWPFSIKQQRMWCDWRICRTSQCRSGNSGNRRNNPPSQTAPSSSVAPGASQGPTSRRRPSPNLAAALADFIVYCDPYLKQNGFFPSRLETETWAKAWIKAKGCTGARAVAIYVRKQYPDQQIHDPGRKK